MNKVNFTKMKNFYPMKDIINWMRRQVTDCEKTFTKDTSDEGPFSKIYKQHLKFLNKLTNGF